MLRPSTAGYDAVRTIWNGGIDYEAEDRVRAAYGPNYDRLADVKVKYDSTNLIRHNQNINPA